LINGHVAAHPTIDVDEMNADYAEEDKRLLSVVLPFSYPFTPFPASFEKTSIRRVAKGPAGPRGDG